MNKQSILIVLFFSLLLASFFLTESRRTVVYSLTENFTVPTRTPTPAPPPPTQPPPPDDGGGGGSDPQPEPTQSQSPADPTATATTAVNFAPTPEGGFFPTAEACSTQPTLLAQATTNVRQGPGIDYGVISQLIFLEVRPIIGRAGEAPWWQILLANGDIGWVFDEIVQTQGNLSVVPIIEAPPIDGISPTPGSDWTPEIPATCTIAPTWTAEPTQTPTTDPQNEATTTPDSLETPVVPTEAPQADNGTEAGAVDLEPVPLVIDSPSSQTVPVPSNEVPVATAVPLPPITNQTPPANGLVFLVGGVVLMAVFGAVIFRRPFN